MKVAYIKGQALGAIPNGTRIVKKIYEHKDVHDVGAKGTVLSSVGPTLFEGKPEYGYFVIWDDRPGLAVFVVGYKIEEEKPLFKERN